MEHHWNGKPLSDYTKDELIGIIGELGQIMLRERKQTDRMLDVLMPAAPSPLHRSALAVYPWE